MSLSKLSQVISLFGFVTCSLAVNAEEGETLSYKCWVTLQNDRDVISFHRLATHGNSQLASHLVKKQGKVLTIAGERPLKTVHECVGLYREFVSQPAQELDKKTVR